MKKIRGIEVAGTCELVQRGLFGNGRSAEGHSICNCHVFFVLRFSLNQVRTEKTQRQHGSQRQPPARSECAATHTATHTMGDVMSVLYPTQNQRSTVVSRSFSALHE